MVWKKAISILLAAVLVCSYPLLGSAEDAPSSNDNVAETVTAIADSSEDSDVESEENEHQGQDAEKTSRTETPASSDRDQAFSVSKLAASMKLLEAQFGTGSNGFDASALPVYELPELSDNIGELNAKWLEMEGSLEGFGQKGTIDLDLSLPEQTLSLRDVFEQNFGDVTAARALSTAVIPESFDIAAFLQAGNEEREKSYGSFMSSAAYSMTSIQTNMSSVFTQMEKGLPSFSFSMSYSPGSVSQNVQSMASSLGASSSNQRQSAHGAYSGAFAAATSAYQMDDALARFTAKQSAKNHFDAAVSAQTDTLNEYIAEHMSDSDQYKEEVGLPTGVGGFVMDLATNDVVRDLAKIAADSLHSPLGPGSGRKLLDFAYDTMDELIEKQKESQSYMK